MKGLLNLENAKLLEERWGNSLPLNKASMKCVFLLILKILKHIYSAYHVQAWTALFVKTLKGPQQHFKKNYLFILQIKKRKAE